jgi:Recombination endonuclease VII
VKRCKHCGIEKPLEDFYVDRKARDGRRPDCKVCNLARRRLKYAEDPRPYIDRALKWQRENRERHLQRMRDYNATPAKKISNRKSHLKRKYGLTLEAFDELLASQGGGCAICGRPEPDNVDHDHETGRVRGILCFTCNVAIGLIGEDEERLNGALSYLARDDQLANVARSRTVALTG